MKGNTERGSMALTMGLVILSAIISLAIIAATLGPNLANRRSMDNQESRTLVETIYARVLNTYARQSNGTLDFTDTGANSTSTFKDCDAAIWQAITYNSSRVRWKACYKTISPPLAGQVVGEGRYLYIAIERSGSTRYFRGPVQGARLIAGRSTQKVGSSMTAPDGTNSAYGFVTEGVLRAGDGTNPSLYSYTPGNASSVTVGAPTAAAAYTLNQTNTERMIIGNQGVENFDTLCAGTGCAAATFTKTNASFKGAGIAAPFSSGGTSGTYSVPSGESTTPKCSELKTWATSENTVKTLTIPTEGACYLNVNFDENTSIVANGPLYIMGNGTLRVAEGVTVNAPSTTPNVMSFRILGGDLIDYTEVDPGANTGASIVMESGSSLGARIAFRECTFTNATLYGSATCEDNLDARGSRLYWQRDFATTDFEAQWMPDRMRNMLSWEPLAYAGDINFQEVAKAQAGGL